MKMEVVLEKKRVVSQQLLEIVNAKVLLVSQKLVFNRSLIRNTFKDDNYKC